MLRHLLSLMLLAVVALLGTAFAGCESPAHRTDRDEVVVLVEALVEGLDPRYAVSGYGVKVSRLVAAPLVSVDTKDLSVKMELAESVDQPSPTTYVVTLRSDARFSNGRPVTTEDVRATIESITSPKSYSPYRWVWRRVAEMDIISDRRIRFELKAPHSPFLTDLDIGVLPAELARNNPSPLPDGKLIGAGPFRVVHRSSQKIELARNPHYHAGPPKLAKVVVKSIQDDNSRLIMLAGGSADLTQNTIPAVLLPAIRDYPELEVLAGRSVTHTYVGINLTHPILGKRKVREALAYALDRDTLIESKLRGYASLATGILPSFHWAHNGSVQSHGYDPARARRLLDEAGHPRPPDGSPRFRIVYKTSNNPFRVSLARVMANMLGRVGVAVEVRPYEWGVFYADVKKSSFEIFTMQMTELAVPDYHYHFFHSSSIPGADLLEVNLRQAAWLAENLEQMEGVLASTALRRLSFLASSVLPGLLLRAAFGFRARSAGGGNRFIYRNPEVDWLLDGARMVSDRDVQKELYGRVQAILHEQLPIIPLWHEDNLAVARCDLRGYELLPNARFSSLAETWKAEGCE